MFMGWVVVENGNFRKMIFVVLLQNNSSVNEILSTSQLVLAEAQTFEIICKFGPFWEGIERYIRRSACSLFGTYYSGFLSGTGVMRVGKSWIMGWSVRYWMTMICLGVQSSLQTARKRRLAEPPSHIKGKNGAAATRLGVVGCQAWFEGFCREEKRCSSFQNHAWKKFGDKPNLEHASF